MVKTALLVVSIEGTRPVSVVVHGAIVVHS